MLIPFLQKNPFSRNIIYAIGKKRARGVIRKFEKFLQKSDRILDVGSGVCNICEVLQGRGHRVVPLDIENLSFVDAIQPVLYDGERMPFGDNSFDVALMVTVLHHAKDPEKIVKETMRVSKKMIIVEDIYTNVFQKYATFIFDSMINLEFIGHPHTNKSDAQWRDLFSKLKLRVMNVDYSYFYGIFKQATYYVGR